MQPLHLSVGQRLSKEREPVERAALFSPLPSHGVAAAAAAVTAAATAVAPAVAAALAAAASFFPHHWGKEKEGKKEEEEEEEEEKRRRLRPVATQKDGRQHCYMHLSRRPVRNSKTVAQLQSPPLAHSLSLCVYDSFLPLFSFFLLFQSFNWNFSHAGRHPCTVRFPKRSINDHFSSIHLAPLLRCWKNEKQFLIRNKFSILFSSSPLSSPFSFFPFDLLFFSLLLLLLLFSNEFYFIIQFGFFFEWKWFLEILSNFFGARPHWWPFSINSSGLFPHFSLLLRCASILSGWSFFWLFSPLLLRFSSDSSGCFYYALQL